MKLKNLLSGDERRLYFLSSRGRGEPLEQATKNKRIYFFIQIERENI
jgi:hypothetical protein